MRLLLQPNKGKQGGNLRSVYQKAIREASELVIVTAYLTEWSTEVQLNPACESLTFIVGTDFGLTRKAACHAVLKWLPRDMKGDFFAADGIEGFHPKLIAWKKKSGQCSLLVGSSNLTQAAFSTNHEANLHCRIPEETFQRISAWVSSIRVTSSPISEDWIASYHESNLRAKKTRRRMGKAADMSRFLPKAKYIDEAVLRRRKNQKAFNEIRDDLFSNIQDCAHGRIQNAVFYSNMMALWFHHRSRFQLGAFQITAKSSNWKEICGSLTNILDGSEHLSSEELDKLVRREIDRLSKQGHPARKSWFSEMLCHFFPKKYPVLNSPVEKWLRINKYRAPRGASEGARYIDLANKLRLAIRNNVRNQARNLAELDQAVWSWYEENILDD